MPASRFSRSPSCCSSWRSRELRRGGWSLSRPSRLLSSSRPRSGSRATVTASRRAIAFYDRGLARIEDRWIGTGEPGDRFADDHHLYANDLDLFGRGSLFELLSVAATPAGEETLAAWLKSPATGEEVGARQAPSPSSRPRSICANRSAAPALDVRTDVHTEPLLRWAEHRETPLAALARLDRSSLYRRGRRTILFVAATRRHQAPARRPRRPVAVHLANCAASSRRFTGRRPAAISARSRLLTLIEREAFEAPRCVTFSRDGRRVMPLAAIRRLHWLVESARLAAQQCVPHVLDAIPDGARTSRGRSRRGARGTAPRVRRGSPPSAEFEALTSLSAYDTSIPTIRFQKSRRLERPAHFEGKALGHPLLPAAAHGAQRCRAGRNDASLVVSGSNMSGKSTLLRTVGINAVLALAGAPVRAQSLRLSPLAIGATLRIQDSLQEGRSRFYAEITRVRELADLARPRARPLLFLLDELFHGTNSHDRLVGAAGVLRSLLDRGAIGLVTTHDLALTAIADELAPRAATCTSRTGSRAARSASTR